MRKNINLMLAGLASVLLLVLAGCGGSSDDSGGDGSDRETSEPSESDPVTLTYWSNANNMDKVVDVWNADHPEIQVELTDPGSTDDIVAKILAAAEGGTAPDMADIPQASLSQLVVGGGAVDLTDRFADVTDKFSQGSLDSVTLDGSMYGVPLDVGPMMLVYRKDLLDKAGIAVPTSWDEFVDAARQVREEMPGSYLAQFDPANYFLFIGMTSQAGGDWWSVDGDEWTVDIDGEASQAIASYWQMLVDEDLVATGSDWTPAWSKALNNGSLLTGPFAVWGVGTVTSLAPDTAGKWRAAAAPTWQGSSVVGPVGGSCTVITSSSEKVDAASEFIHWLEAGDGALEIGKTQYPASIPAHESLTTPPAGIEGQTDFYEIAAEASANLASVTWGPNTTVAFRSFTDEFTAAIKNGTPLVDALQNVQATVVADMESKGFKVAG